VVQEQIRDLERRYGSLQDAFGAPPPGAQDVQVRGAIPPTTARRTAPPADAVVRAEREAARALAAAARQADQEERKVLHDRARLPAPVDHLDFERRLMAFHALCDEQRTEEARAKTVSSRETEEDLRMKVEHVRTTRKVQRAEFQLLGSIQTFQRVQRNSQAQVDAANQLHAQEMQRQREVGARREKISSEKAKAAHRREAAEAVRLFQAKRACLERLTAAQSRAAARREDGAEAAGAVRARRRERAEQAGAAAARRQDSADELRRRTSGASSRRRAPCARPPRTRSCG